MERTMNVEFGVMQGRLSPRYQGRYQSHPTKHWQSEFFIAAEMGYSLIEFIVDAWSLDTNPLLNPEGIQEVVDLVEASGVSVKTLCADVFMDLTFVGEQFQQAEILLARLIKVAKAIGIRDVVIPCVDRSSLMFSDDLKTRFVERIQSWCKRAAEDGVRINLETDLAPQEFSALLDAIGRETVWVNYDIGNSASLGFEPAEEFSCYGDRVSNVHIKDRVRDGGSVFLGTGNASFDAVFWALHKLRFEGPMIFQAARAESFILDLSQLEKQTQWFMKKWNAYQS